MIRTAMMMAVAGLATVATAGPVYTFSGTPSNGLLTAHGGVNNNAGTILEVTSTWNAGSERLSFNLVTDGGTDGFWLALSPGDNPKGHAGELALIYFDRGQDRGGVPSMAVYAYNGVNGSNSWNNPGDFIVSTEDGSGWDANLSQGNTVDGDRFMSFDIDASVIQNHTPAFPGSSPWTGVEFGERAGIWMHTVENPINGGVDYDTDGQLTQFSYGRQGWWDGAGIGTQVVIPLPTTAALGLAGVGLVGIRRRR
ncbi:MAG: hypothetical protein AAF747_10470 [Planctomycetota bacterium]